MGGHVIGITLTHDQRYVLANVRPWLFDEGMDINSIVPHEPPEISGKIELRVIDLHTLCVVRSKSFVGHEGYTENSDCFFLFADGNDRYVTSGAESIFGHVWSRDYSCTLGLLAHTNVVSCVAINPTNTEQCVSVSDDYTIKVWCSRRFLVEHDIQDIQDIQSVHMDVDK